MADTPRDALEALIEAAEYHASPYQGHYDAWEAALDSARAALAADPAPAPPPAAEGEVAELVGLIRMISLAWEPDACLLGNMTAGQLTRAADLLERGTTPAPVPCPACEGSPAPGNTPCAVCGTTPALAPVPERYCPTHGHQPGNTWGCPECVREMREELAQTAPVPVAERLPGPEDCDAKGRCWCYTPREDVDGVMIMHSRWMLSRPCGIDTHWLPAHALPLPEVAP